MTNTFNTEEKDIVLPVIIKHLPAELFFKSVREVSKTAVLIESGILDEFSSSEMFVIQMSRAFKEQYADNGTLTQFPDDIKRMLGMSND